ncbi:MAG TPA: hypothetical protein ENK23_05415 [Sorangium sp.]|nr:hypothetical protein [Sorangium sp.]
MTMLILEHQMEIFWDAREAAYAHRLARYLRNHYANANDIDEAQVRALVLAGQAAGLDSERQLAIYVAGTWLFGDAFLAGIEPLRDDFRNDTIGPEAIAQLLLEQFEQLEARTSL